MTKTLRASVSFPPALHRSLKLAIAVADPRVTLNDYVSRAVETSSSISDGAVEIARAKLIHHDAGHVVRSTVKFPVHVAERANIRARHLDLSPSEFIAAVVAHRLNQHGK